MRLDLTDIDDNEAATRSLREWCQQLGFRIKDSDDGLRFVVLGARRWIVSVKANKNGNHRLLATCVFGTVAGYMGKDEWHKFCNDINARLNIGKFCLNDADMFEIQFSLYFLESLDPRLFRNFLAHIDEGTTHVLTENREILSGALE